MVSILSDDWRFSDLALLFNEYWSQAAVLTSDVLDNYARRYANKKAISDQIAELEISIDTEIGEVLFSNINRGNKKKSSENLFIDEYRKTHQECLFAFTEIRQVYKAIGRRKAGDDVIPLLLEIDSFISYIREVRATGDTWLEAPIRQRSERRSHIQAHVESWLDYSWPYFDEDIVTVKYPTISAGRVQQSTLCHLHRPPLLLGRLLSLSRA